MNLAESYKKIKPSIVAIVSRNVRVGASFPDIIGTGFFIRDDGLVLTNHHVLQAIGKLQKAPNETFADIITVLYFELDTDGMKVVAIAPDSAAMVDMQREAADAYYGPDRLDVALISLPGIKDCPAVTISDIQLEEGQDVALAGFPMGTDTLKAPGWLHQIGPTLQRGTIGAILPFVCPTPHGILIDTMIQGGSSGSPVFLPESGEVVGIMHSSLRDFEREINPQSGYAHVYAQPTSLSIAVPGWYLKKVLERAVIDNDRRPPGERISLKDYMKQLPHAKQVPKKAWVPINAKDVKSST